MTQSQLAAEVGTDQGTISHWEKGQQTIPDRMKARLAKALRVPGVELFPWDDLEAAS